MEERRVKSGEAIEMAVSYYGFTMDELAMQKYPRKEDRMKAKKTLQRLLKSWYSKALSNLPYDENESVWDHYAKDKSMDSPDRLIPVRFVQHWYMVIDRERFKDLFRSIQRRPNPVKGTFEQFELERELIDERERKKDYDIDADKEFTLSGQTFADEIQMTSIVAAKKEIERQKFLLLWQEYLKINGVFFGEEEEQRYIEDFCLRDDRHESENHDLIFQELNDRLKDIRNYFRHKKI